MRRLIGPLGAGISMPKGPVYLWHIGHWLLSCLVWRPGRQALYGAGSSQLAPRMLYKLLFRTITDQQGRPIPELVARRLLSCKPNSPCAINPQAGRYAEGVRRFDFDSGLAPYDLAACATWHDLSCFIDEPLLQRLMPVSFDSDALGQRGRYRWR